MTIEENIDLLKELGIKTIITTTPRYEGRSFGSNMLKAALTAYAEKGRRLTDVDLNGLIDELRLKPTVTDLKNGADGSVRSLLYFANSVDRVSRITVTLI